MLIFSAPQSQLDRRNAHNADPDPASPPKTPTHSTTQSKPPSQTTHNSPVPTGIMHASRPTIPRRQLPSTSPSVASQNSAAGQQTVQQPRYRQMQHPYELPPIDTGAGIGIDAANIASKDFSASGPASPAAGPPGMRDAQRRAAKAGQSATGQAQVASPVKQTNSLDIDLEERREMCQSPSWDAYSRRKKEKKDKEQADKEAKAKKRRLSKAQPPSPALKSPGPTLQQDKAGPYPPSARRGLAQARTDACMSDSNLAQPRQQKERPASVAGLSTPDLPLPQDIPAAQQPRGRSSSFSSLFRSRRSSVDQSDSGFIGGVKLEQQRLEAAQKDLNEHAVSINDLPPPRLKTDKRSPSPLRIFAPKHEAKDKNQRTYPPIAIKTSGRNQALLAPESPTADDNMSKSWRARMGLKDKKDAKEKGHKLTKSPSALKEDPRIKSLPKSESAPVISSPTIVQRYRGPVDDEKMNMLGTFDPSAHPALTQRSNNQRQACKPGSDQSDETGNSGSETSYNTVPESPPPPPRRSSKRKSLISLGDATNVPSTQPSPHSGQGHDTNKNNEPAEPKRPAPLVPSQTMPEMRQKTGGDRAPRPASNRWSLSDPPSIPYDSLVPMISNEKSAHSKKTLKEAARAAFGRNSLPAPTMPAATSERPASRSRSPMRGRAEHNRNESANALPNTTGNKASRILGMPDLRISAPIQHSPPKQSSEDSCSDDFRSPSEHGTPDTSRPQSERGVFPRPCDKEASGKAQYDSGYTSAYPSPAISQADQRYSNQPSPLELDPIQAAALKVMAAFPDVKPRRPGVERRTSSDPSIAPVKGKQPLQARDSSRPRPIKTNIEPFNDLESKSPPLRDLLMLKDESSVAAPWPATYLEAARKAAPTAPAPKALKQNHASPTQAPKQNSPSLSARQNLDNEPIAKMFVECCSCRYYHDMPSKLYEFMARPQDMVTLGEDMHFAGSVSMTVKCPWCKHEMSTKCCAGLAAMVYVKERLH